jgi:hypothetical protein
MIHDLCPPRAREEKIGGDGAQIASRAVDQDGIFAAPVQSKTVAGKMHLWRFDLVEKNSIFAKRYRRNNFLFTPLAPDIYRK